MEHKELCGPSKARCRTRSTRSPTRQGARLRDGQRRDDRLLVAHGPRAAAEAAETLPKQGIEAELIDLRTLWPWDKARVLASVEKTGRLLVVHEAVAVAGFGAEIAATVAEPAALQGPGRRLGSRVRSPTRRREDVPVRAMSRRRALAERHPPRAGKAAQRAATASRP